MKEKLASLKEKVRDSKNINDIEKKEAIRKIEEWYIEDKAESKDILGKELMKISSRILPLLEEVGLI